ncbi:MAG TPA: hypothetical protein VIE91_04910 [Methylophilaceae bacterium]|jgi:uncharacterized integral membrane protein
MAENITQEHWLETYKSLITLSLEAFRFSALANGGAAVALLAYLGNLAGRPNMAMVDMSCPMMAYLSGLVLCGVSVLFGYLTQLKLLNEIGKTEKFFFGHSCYLLMALGMYIASLTAFGYGSYLAVLRFANS